MKHATDRGPVTRTTVTEVVDGVPRRRRDHVVTEEPMEIRLGWPGHDDARVAVTMRTPGSDFELAAGFLFSEGVIDARRPPHTVAYCTDHALTVEQRFNVVTVTLDQPPKRHPGARATTVSAACGVCGTQSLDEVFTPDHPGLPVTFSIDPALVSTLPDRLRAAQQLFERTGSLHAAGVFDIEGSLLLTREDVGRHNTVDKVLGARLLGRATYPPDSLLCVSGRVGFDVLTKAVMGRFPMVVAVGGASSLAIDLAERAGVTLCAFARGSRFVALTHPARLRGV